MVVLFLSFVWFKFHFEVVIDSKEVQVSGYVVSKQEFP